MLDHIKQFCYDGVKKYGIMSFRDIVLASDLSDETKASVMGILIPLYDEMVHA